MTREGKRLIVNTLVLLLIGSAVTAVYFLFFTDEESELTIDETPLQIESIRTIAEISTVSYRDEVVMDTVEFHKDDYYFYDYRKWTSMYDRGVKRRLTLIVKGEVKYGFNLKSSDFAIKKKNDTLIITLPEPKILDVIVTPSETEIFQEQGEWKDQVRRNLESKAKNKLRANSAEMDLEDKAKMNVARLFEKLLGSSHQIILKFAKDA